MKNNQKKQNAKNEEYYEISFFYLFISFSLTLLSYRSFGGFISFVTLGGLLISHFIFSQIKSGKSEKLYEINTYKYPEYRKNAC